MTSPMLASALSLAWRAAGIGQGHRIVAFSYEPRPLGSGLAHRAASPFPSRSRLVTENAIALPELEHLTSDVPASSRSPDEWPPRDRPTRTAIPAADTQHRSCQVWQAVLCVAPWPECLRSAADRPGAAPAPLHRWLSPGRLVR